MSLSSDSNHDEGELGTKNAKSQFKTPRMNSEEHTPAPKSKSNSFIVGSEEEDAIPQRTRRSSSVFSFGKKKSKGKNSDIKEEKEEVKKKGFASYIKKLKKKGKDDISSISKMHSSDNNSDSDNENKTETETFKKGNIFKRLNKKSKKKVTEKKTDLTAPPTETNDNSKENSNSENDLSDIEGCEQSKTLTAAEMKKLQRDNRNQTRNNELQDLRGLLDKEGNLPTFVTDQRKLFLRKPEEPFQHPPVMTTGKSSTPVLDFNEPTHKAKKSSSASKSKGGNKSAGSTSKRLSLPSRKKKKKDTEDSMDTEDDLRSVNSSAGRSRMSTGADSDSGSLPEIVFEESTTDQPGGIKKSWGFNGGVESLTVISDDSEEDIERPSKKKHKQFLGQFKSKPSLNAGKQPSKASVTKVTRMTAIDSDNDADVDVDCSFPETPWDPVEYDADLQGDEIDDDGQLSCIQTANLLADPSGADCTVLIDTRGYEDYTAGHVVCAKHISDFRGEDREFDAAVVKTEFSTAILYDEAGQSLASLESDMSKCYDALRKLKLTVYVIANGFAGIKRETPYLLSQKTTDNLILPTIFDKGKIIFGNSLQMKPLDIIERFGVVRVVTCDAELVSQLNKVVNLDHLLVKCGTLFTTFEEIIQFIVKGPREEFSVKGRTLICCDYADSNSASIVIAYLMFINHWSMVDAYLYMCSQRHSIMKPDKINLKALLQIEWKLYKQRLTTSLTKTKQRKKSAAEQHDASSSDDQAQTVTRLKKLKLKFGKSRKSTAEEEHSAVDEEEENKKRPDKISKLRERRLNRRKKNTEESAEEMNSDTEDP